MKITTQLITALNPCKDRLDNYLQHYSNLEFTFDDFIDLEHISYNDKIWVAKQVLNKNQLCHFGLLCAESVLNIFESKYPEDKRVGDCIRYLIKVKNFEDITKIQKEKIIMHRDAAYAAYAAAYAADAAAAADAAYAAAYAAYAADAAAAADAYADAYAAYTADAAAADADAADAAYAAVAYAADADAADAAYAAVAYAADAAYAAYAAYAAAYADARKNQEDLNLQFLKMAATL